MRHQSSHIGERKGGFIPRLIFWELTQRCNLRCRHCRASAGGEEPIGLPLGKIISIIDDIASSGFRPLLVLTGGEPLERPDLFDIAKYARSAGFPLALASNGTMIDSKTADLIKESGFRRVSISLDGAVESTHDDFRGLPGSFKAALAGMEHVRRAGVEVQINFTVHRKNASELERMADLARSVGAAALHIFMLVPVGCGMDLGEDVRLSPAEYEEVLERFYELTVACRDLELRATCAPHFMRILRKHGVKLPPGARGCLAGTGVCFISHDAKVRPCGYFAADAGDLLKQSFKDIWDNSSLFRDLRDVSLLKGKCGRCEFASVCMGCRARALGTTGDYLDEEPTCLYEPKKRG